MKRLTRAVRKSEAGMPCPFLASEASKPIAPIRKTAFPLPYQIAALKPILPLSVAGRFVAFSAFLFCALVLAFPHIFYISLTSFCSSSGTKRAAFPRGNRRSVLPVEQFRKLSTENYAVAPHGRTVGAAKRHCGAAVRSTA